MTLTEKVAYLKGLAEGLELDDQTKEAKIFKVIFDILDDLALTVTDIDDTMELFEEHLNAVDEDLDELESFVYEGLDEEYDDDGMFELTCPSCGEDFCVDNEIIDEDYIECPSCGKKLEFDFDEGCECGCDHDEDDE